MCHCPLSLPNLGSAAETPHELNFSTNGVIWDQSRKLGDRMGLSGEQCVTT